MVIKDKAIFYLSVLCLVGLGISFNALACHCHCFSLTVRNHLIGSSNVTWDQCRHICKKNVEEFLSCY